MSSNYPLPSKAALVQQFVGKTLKDIPLPAAVIDIAAVRRNCQRMSDAVKDLGFDFAPLVNVHKVRTDNAQVEKA
jgi:D-serine deaminase-like pyridoxal phosphate-dependent protein